MAPRWLTHGNRPVWPSVGDVVIGVLLTVFVVGTHFRAGGDASLPLLIGLAVIGGALVAFRRRWPMGVLLASVLLVAVALLAAERNLALLGFAEIALFTVAVQTDRRTTVITAMATAVLLYLGVVLRFGVGWDQGATVGILAWTGLFAAAGDATRNRRSYVAAIEERARKAESERDTEAARQVAEERLRIARELHDVLAHHIAVIHVHAGLADATMTTSPTTSKESLGYIRQAAAEVLGELKALIPVLRSDSDDNGGDPAQPAPGLERLDELIDSYQRAGFPVRVTVGGKPQLLRAATDLAAYRIIQEALTNAAKHGVPGSCELTVSYAPDRLDVLVTNRVQDGRGVPIGTGHGLIGMRERAASVGGRLKTGQRSDVYTVDLALDLTEQTVAAVR